MPGRTTYNESIPLATRAKISAEGVKLKPTDPKTHLALQREKYFPIAIGVYSRTMTGEEKDLRRAQTAVIDQNKKRIAGIGMRRQNWKAWRMRP